MNKHQIDRVCRAVKFKIGMDKGHGVNRQGGVYFRWSGSDTNPSIWISDMVILQHTEDELVEYITYRLEEG